MTTGSSQVGLDICRALDLDPQRVTKLTMTVEAGQPPRLEIEMWDLDAMRKVENITQRYEFMVEKHPMTMEDAILWRDPPADGRTGEGRLLGTGPAYVRAFVRCLEENPGRWAQYRPGHGHSPGSASSEAFRGLDHRLVIRPDGKHDLYLQYPDHRGGRGAD